ncbi:MAG: S8 family serine peptidase [Candidatus Micrarchaeota archaeon]|nr:S8 family serine peptidase [Candidatus Micrarchaeota archaeon]
MILVLSVMSFTSMSKTKAINVKKIDAEILNQLANHAKGTKDTVVVIISFNSENKKIKGIFGITEKAVNSKDYFSDFIKSKRGKILYRYNTINAISAKIPAELAAELSLDPDVKMIHKSRTNYILLQDSVPLIKANYTWARTLNETNVTGAGETICILDTGVDYTHPDLGNCSITNHTFNGNTQTYSQESNHPYTNNGVEAYTITAENFTRIAVHFSNITMERDWDFVKVYDGNYTLVATYTGAHTDIWSPSVEGDTIYVHTDSDESVVDYGFIIDMVINGSVNTTINWSSCEKVIQGWDVVNNDADPIDDNGHGTHVAGIAAANGTIKGIAPDARIVAVKVCNSTGGCPGNADLAGMDWCINNSERYNISVISMSFGGGLQTSYCDSSYGYYSDMINSAILKNISVVISSGNDYSTTGISVPACIENATKITATDKNDAFASFANRGSGFTDLLTAPGVSINSTKMNGGYVQMDGTSMSTPHVSGAIALLNQMYRFYHNSLPDPLIIRERLKETGVVLHDSGSNFNYSRIDVDAAADSLIPPSITVESPINGSLHPAHADFNFTSDESLNTSWMQVDSEGIVYLSNDTDYHWYYTTYNDLASGAHNVTFYANDPWGNQNQTTVWFDVDAQAPSITIYYPWNITILKNESIDLNYTVSDAGTSVNSCWYSLDNGANISLPSCLNVTFDAAEGEHNITIYANDSVGNIGSNTTFFNTTTNPVVAITAPHSGWHNSTHLQLNFTYNSYYAAHTCWYNLNNNATNTTIPCTNGSIINATEGANALTLWANNTYGKTDSDSVSFNVDSIIPHILLLYPTPGNNTLLTNNGSFMINVSHYDANADTLLLIIDDAINRSVSYPDNFTNFTVTLSDGAYSYYAVANDTVNNTNQTERRYITIDTTSPSVAWNSGTTMTGNLSQNYIFLNCSLTDANRDMTGYFNGTANVTAWTGNDGTNFWANLTGLSDGTYADAYCWANDSASHYNQTSAKSWTVDTTSPTGLNYVSPTSSDNTNLSQDYYYANITFTETNPDTCLLDDGTSNVTMTRVGTNCYYNKTSQSDGTYTYRVYINDTAGNLGVSASRTVTLDTTNPSIASPSLFPHLLYADENLTWRATINDNHISDIWYKIINSTSNVVHTYYVSGSGGLTNVSYNTTGLAIGTYSIRVYANDSAGNIANELAGSFEIGQKLNITIEPLEADGDVANATLKLLYNDTSTQRSIAENSSLTTQIAQGLWNLMLIATTMNVTMNDVNMTSSSTLSNVSFNENISASVITPSDIGSRAREIRKLVSVYTYLDFLSGVVLFSYDDSGLNENHLSVWVCHSWNMSSDECNGSWENATSNSTINTTSNTVEINTTSFSSFALIQDKYCGDGTCDSGLETCSSCSTDCGSCPSDTTGGSSSSGAAVSGGGADTSSLSKSMDVSIEKDSFIMNTGIAKNISIYIKNTGEANLTDIAINLTYACNDCLLSPEKDSVKLLEPNETENITLSMTFADIGIYSIGISVTATEGPSMVKAITVTVQEPIKNTGSMDNACNYNKKCESELGENKDNCPDCSSNMCIQVITPARNPETGECKEFATPCDVPKWWEKVERCEEDIGTKKAIQPQTDIYIIIVMLIILIAGVITYYFRFYKKPSKIPREASHKNPFA